MDFMPRKLSQKLVLSLTIIFVAVGTIASIMHVRTQERQLLDAMVLGADQLSGSITSATWHAMRADQREVAYEIMQTIALKQGISKIRIFNKEGRVMFSTITGDTGQVDKDAEACSMCHSAAKPLVKVDVPSRSRVYYASDGERRLGMITPIYNEPSCSNADCHAHPPSMSVLGVLDVSLDLARVDEEIAWIQRRVAIITGALVILMSAFIVVFIKHFVSTPIKELIDGTRAVSAMQLDTPITISSTEELGELAASFDTMRIRLKEAVEELNRFTQQLETKVEERTEQLKVAHQRLLQSDRLASLGQLSASVAHEINNPLSGVLNLSMLMQRILKDDGIPTDRIDEFRKYLMQVVNETARVGRIVQELLAFSRRSKQQQTTVNLNSIITTTVNLISHKLKLMNVSVELRLDDAIPQIKCDSSQIQQVLMNLMMNGAEAAQNKPNGKLLVRTGRHQTTNDLLLEVTDNGDGIPDDVLPKIFDPFYTTKENGKGVGLGLAVVYGIVQAHHGEIEVLSKITEGTTFAVRLPLEQGVNESVVSSSEVGNTM
jgi:two-component system, NtrC family, sensor kinase